MNHDDQFSDTNRWRKRANWVLLGFLAIAAYFLITEHRAHLAGLLYFLPYLFLLACPLMHLFMHHGHDGHGGHGDKREEDAPVRPGERSESKQGPASTQQHHH